MAEIELPHFRRAFADVPEDVDPDDLPHFNDPNFDMRSIYSTSTDNSLELEDKKKAYSVDDHKFSSAGSDFDTESALGTTTRGGSSRAELREDHDDESLYPEVRAAVSSIDDPMMPVNTFRMWIVGLLFTVLISALNQVFNMRSSSVAITGIVAQLLALPVGRFFEMILPSRNFRTFGRVWTLNPGPFNIKEHTCVTVMANVVVLGAYATDVVATQRAFYGQNWGFGYTILIVLSTQLIGYSYAGLVRQFLVWPSSMIWPGALVNAALFNTLHKNYGKRERGHMTRERFFLIAFAASFCWYWFPGYLFTALSMFSWACWIAPQNVVVNQLFGTVSGLGMGVVTFDWGQIAYFGSPLVQPWWAAANTFVAFVLMYWILTPIFYYKNIWFSQYMPISAAETFDRFGQSYDVTQIMDASGRFNQTAYENYSPIYMPTSFALSYGTSFATITATIVHIFLWYRRDLVRQFSRKLKDEKDVHSRLMSAYPETPLWWFGALFLFAFVLGIAAIEGYDTQLPIWAYLLALLVAAIFVVPTGIIQAIANQTVYLNVLAELIAGYALPGRPVANMLFKTYGYVAAMQAVQFSADLKLGHYMKIPPRVMFTVQTVATIVSCFVVVGVQQWLFANIPDFCSPDQADGWTCPQTSTFASASIIWGAIGPQRVFSYGGLYYGVIFFFLIGALCPIPFYYLARRRPQQLWRYVNMPAFWNGASSIPPATGINYASWFAVAFVFQFFMRRRHFRWWMRYNYILSAALDSGVALGVIVIFFTLTFPKNGTIGANTIQTWWGNTVWQNTVDAAGAATLPIPDAGFGLQTWS